VFNFSFKRYNSKQPLDFISPHLAWPYSRAIATTNAGNDAAIQEHLYTVGNNVN
jgi:hypothetical protein